MTHYPQGMKRNEERKEMFSALLFGKLKYKDLEMVVCYHLGIIWGKGLVNCFWSVHVMKNQQTQTKQTNF